MMPPANPSDSTPVPTPALRCALALNLLQQRAHDERTIALAKAALEGKTLGQLIDLEVSQ